MSFHITFLHVILPSRDSCVSESFSVSSNVLILSSSAVAPLLALIPDISLCIPWMTQYQLVCICFHALCTPRLCSCINITSNAFPFAQFSRFRIFVPHSHSIRSHCMCTFWVSLPGPLLGIRGCYRFLLGVFSIFSLLACCLYFGFPFLFSWDSRGRDRLVVSVSLCLLASLVLVSWYMCRSGSYLYWVLLCCLTTSPSFSLSCPWGVPRCCLGSLQSWDSLRRLPWSTLLTPSFSAQALREWRRADGFCTFRPLVCVRVWCATRSIRCIVLGLCDCLVVLSCRSSLRCLFLWA